MNFIPKQAASLKKVILGACLIMKKNKALNKIDFENDCF